MRENKEEIIGNFEKDNYEKMAKHYKDIIFVSEINRKKYKSEILSKNLEKKKYKELFLENSKKNVTKDKRKKIELIENYNKKLETALKNCENMKINKTKSIQERLSDRKLKLLKHNKQTESILDNKCKKVAENVKIKEIHAKESKIKKDIVIDDRHKYNSNNIIYRAGLIDKVNSVKLNF